MLRIVTLFLLIACICAVGGAAAQEVGAGSPPAENPSIKLMREKGFVPAPASILEMEGLVKSQRLSTSDVQMYQVNREIPGMTDMMYGFASESDRNDLTGVAEYLEVVSMEVDGETMHFVRPVPPEEVERRRMEAGGVSPEVMADFLDMYSVGALMVGSGLRKEMPQLAGFAPGGSPFADPETAELAAYMATSFCGDMVNWDHPLDERNAGRAGDYDYGAWVNPDPLIFMTGIACFTQFTAGVLRASDLTEDQKQAEIARARAELDDRLQYRGQETVDGRPTFALTADNLDMSQTMEDGSRVEFQTATVWIDAEYFVRRKTRFEGVMHAEGESREFFMERLERDYRDVPGTDLYEPYLSVLRVGGMTTPQQEREMQEALAQLEEFDRQMASMPASQRAMMERMMGDKIEQARALAQGGAVEFEMITTSIVVNPDLGAGPPSLLGEVALIRVIQQDLTTLGYDPGPITGELTEQTRAAIVKFQTDTGLEPTGEATPALGSALKAAIAALGGG